jgi:hypothetical protein
MQSAGRESRANKSPRGHRIRFAVHNDVGTSGAGIGAELHVARPPLLARRWQANRSKGKVLLGFDRRETAKSGNDLSVPVVFFQKRKRSPTVGSTVLRLR